MELFKTEYSEIYPLLGKLLIDIYEKEIVQAQDLLPAIRTLLEINIKSIKKSVSTPPSQFSAKNIGKIDKQLKRKLLKNLKPVVKIYGNIFDEIKVIEKKTRIFLINFLYKVQEK